METAELIKKWSNETLPKFPPPKFNIGDVIRRTDDNESDHPRVIVGIRLAYLVFQRRHIWYYEVADHIASYPPVTAAWSDEDDLLQSGELNENEKWYITGGATPIVPVCECWQCHQIRVDDLMDCPYCSADSTPF